MALTAVDVTARDQVCWRRGSPGYVLGVQSSLDYGVSTLGRPYPIPRYWLGSTIGTRQRGHASAGTVEFDVES